MFATWAQKNGYDPEKVSPVHKLAFIGSRGMGALEFYPQEDVSVSAAALEIDEIIGLASKKPETRDLKLAGLDRMTYETKIELVIRYLS